MMTMIMATCSPKSVTCDAFFALCTALPTRELSKQAHCSGCDDDDDDDDDDIDDDVDDHEIVPLEKMH